VSAELVPEHAAASLSGANRLLVVGNCGAGKSTIARVLAARLDLPLISLDRHFWRAGWLETPAAEWRERRVPELIAGSRWLIEGQYTGSLALRLTRADAVLHLDMPRLTCLRRVLERSLIPAPRPDLPPGCPERVDPVFLKFVWTNHERGVPRVREMLDEASKRLPVGRLRDPAQVERFLEALP
jgi:adenylate kinase family enzyme